MPLTTPLLATARKTPRQARAKVTVAAILEAAARILEKEGEAALTTAAVARLAGCSIGTLYQYFSDRDEILVGLVDREQQRIIDKTHELVRRTGTGPQPAATRELVRVLIASFAARRGARRQFELVMTLGARKGKSAELAEAFADALVRRSNVGKNGAEQQVVRARAFVVTRAMLGVLRAAALEKASVIKEPAFEDALCLMVDALRPQ